MMTTSPAPATVASAMLRAESRAIFRRHPSVTRIRQRWISSDGTSFLFHITARRHGKRIVNAWLDVDVTAGTHATLILRDLTGYVKLTTGYYARVTRDAP